MALTDAKLRNLKPREKPYKTADYDGLYVLTNPTGSRLWRFKYRVGGKEKVLAIGAYPAVSLVEARQVRDEARSQLSKDIDPNEAKREQALGSKLDRENTFSKIANQYFQKIEKEGRAASTLTKTAWLLEIANNGFGSKPIMEITAPVILATLKKIEAKGTYETARRLRSTIGAVFRFAIANGLADNDPTFPLRDALITPKVKHRAAITDKEEFGALLRAIDGFEGQPTTKFALQLLALFASRPGELRHTKWSEFNFEKLIWEIPAERTKMRRPHMVPLSAQSIELLLELKKYTGWGDLLFPSTRSAKRPISENTMNAALRRMGYSGDEMTSHGFRATFSTIANESGLWNPDAIERALAHAEKNKIRAAYARGEFWEERVKIAEWWGKELDIYKFNIDQDR